MTEEQRWQLLIEGLRKGDANIARQFWDQYGQMLHRLAEKHLAAGVRRRVGPEDVVQSACRTFLRRAQVGEFQLADADSLWRLLCAITLTKVREQTRFHMRQKRGLDQEVRAAELSTIGRADFQGQAAAGPTPAEAAAFSDQFQQLLGDLDEEERQIVELKLQECTHEEIADKLGCSERTVRRIVKRVQERLQQTLQSIS
jgi:RNA polymerase sigma factor (sigma-70 family)